LRHRADFADYIEFAEFGKLPDICGETKKPPQKMGRLFVETQFGSEQSNGIGQIYFAAKNVFLKSNPDENQSPLGVSL
jgi:hypothetical protein